MVITISGTSGTFSKYVSSSITNVFNWTLGSAYEITLNGVNYYSYDVTLTLSYVFQNLTVPYSITSYHSSFYYSSIV